MEYKRTKTACFLACFTMAVAFSLPPVLFVPLREQYGISYTLLGTLVLVNFVTQMGVDLLFTLFARWFPVKWLGKTMPLVTTFGFVVYALGPTLFPQQAYVWLLIGTVIFSVAAGLSEVLLSPIVAAIPSERPQRDMSLLHSLYGFGVLTVVVVSTLFLQAFGSERWMVLTLMLAALPLVPAVLFLVSPMPELSTRPPLGGRRRNRRQVWGMALCVACIFFGSCAECTMSSWASGFAERALGVDKATGDLLGMAVFAVLLAVTRVVYAKYGKRILPVLLIGMGGATVCYLVAGLSTHTGAVLAACAMTGLFTAMLWPGNLILMEEQFPDVGVTAFALMAVGGDLGASVAPQLMGVVIDTVSVAPWAARLGQTLGLSAEQIGMKAGMLTTALFPLLGVILLLIMIPFFKKKEQA